MGAPPRPILAGFGVRPSTAGKDGEMLVPQRRDVVVLLAAGPTPASAVPRHPGTVSQGAGETGYVYYTAIPRFCAAVTASNGSAPAVVFPTSAGTLGSAVWTPGTVVRAPAAAAAAASGAVASQESRKACGVVGNATSVVLATSPNGDGTWTSRTVGGGGGGRTSADSSASGVQVATSADSESKSETALVATTSDATTSNSPAAATAGVDASVAAVEAGVASTTSRTFTCSECSRDFGSEKYLNMHMSLHIQSAALEPGVGGPCETSATSGGGGVGTTADICVAASTPMVLTSQQQLIMAPPPIRRMKTTTNGAAGTSCTSQWTCQICEKTFAQNSNYKNHIRTHSNERPFVCEICAIGYCFRIFDHLYAYIFIY